MSLSFYTSRLQTLKKQNQFRSLRSVDARKNTQISVDGHNFLNLSSNDYLGLASRLELKEEFEQDFLSSFPADQIHLGSSSSRLLTGNSLAYTLLEDRLETLYGKPSLCYNSGYHANVGTLSCLAGKNDVIFSDKLNHASIIDGMKLSEATYYRYQHNNTKHLEKLIRTHRSKYQNAWIVSESVFSMDGDRANLKELVRIKKEHDCFLFVDEAHAVGVFGSKGLGLSEQEALIENMDLIVGTFGKALSSTGAFVITKQVLKDYLINHSRSLIFSTALPSYVLLWSLFVLEKAIGLSNTRMHLQEISNQLRTSLKEQNLPTRGNSQIVPVILGENKKAVETARKLQEQGFLIFPIRPPTVPVGTARLRLSLTADLSSDQIERIGNAIKEALK